MINAELTHNPYLLITKVKFNGQDPKINCQIEKYEKLPLKDWVHLVPEIFYNEMNGYDFDFFFVGTNSDFEEVKKSFEKAGVSEEQVRLFFKNEIEGADKKSEEIDSLLTWLRDNPNRRFDYDEFWENNSELFEGTYPYIIVNGSFAQDMNSSVNMEFVESGSELINTELSSTPILFCINEESRKQFRKDLIGILSRSDIRPEQLFFMIDTAMDAAQVTRVISDLGVSAPQVVNKYDDDAIHMYFRNYPITEYVRTAIAVFSTYTKKIGEVLEKEKKESEIINSEIHAEIDRLEADISSLRKADDFFIQRDNFIRDYEFDEIRKKFVEQIQKWRNRKTKIVGDYEAETAAKDYKDHLAKQVTVFQELLETAYFKIGQSITDEFRDVYCVAGIDLSYIPQNNGLTECDKIIIPDIEKELLKLKEITYEEAKSDFFGLFKKQQEGSSEPVRVATCYLEVWREKVLEIMLPLIDGLIDWCHEELMDYYNDLADDYHNHLSDLIVEITEQKDMVSAQLSEDEKKLQDDNDWLAEVNNQLQNIERG